MRYSLSCSIDVTPSSEKAWRQLKRISPAGRYLSQTQFLDSNDRFHGAELWTGKQNFEPMEWLVR